MKTLILVMTVLVMAFGFSAVGFAGSDQQTGQTGFMCGGMERTYTGRITSMSQTGNWIVVNGIEGDKSFLISGATPNGGLQTGQRVAVNYTERDGQLDASSVSLLQPYQVSQELESHFRAEAQW